MIKLIIGIVVALVIIGGVVWFTSDNKEPTTQIDNSNAESTASSAQSNEVTESSSIESDDEVFAEIDNALEGLE